MSDVAISAGTLEQVLGKGDLAPLSPAQRLEYMSRTCDSLGLNPLTRPFRFLAFQGQVQMYATRDCADQLRATRRVSIEIVDKAFKDGLFVVTARAQTPDGRRDEDLGAVAFGNLQGEARANALMKAITKAKRRVTLSICGLGFLDELEVETLPGAETFAAEEQPAKPSAPSEPAPPAEYPFASQRGGRVFTNRAQWLEQWRRTVVACRKTEALDRLREGVELNRGALSSIAEFDPEVVEEVREMVQVALGEDRAPEAEEELSLP